MKIAIAVLLLLAAGKGRRVTDDQGCEKGIDENNELDGEIVCKRNGVKTYEGLYQHGKRVGVAKTWRDDGTLGSVETFVAGVREGPNEQYGREGKLEEACTYKREKKDGPCKLYTRGVLREERRYVAGEQRGPWTEYWPDGKVREKGTLDASGKRDGPVERFREDGKPDEVQTYAHGEPDGTEKHWYPNGQLERQTEWRAGQRHGLTQRWHDNGQLAETACEQNGKSVKGTGACTGKSGPEVVTSFFPNGKPRSKLPLKDGKRDGEEQRFNAEGVLLESTPWVADERDGVEKQYDGKTGKLRHEQAFKAGKRDGVERLYFDDGTPSEEMQWRADARGDRTTWWMNGKKKTFDGNDGELALHRDWDDQGVLVEESTWKNGRRHGLKRGFFSPSGKLQLEETWADGVRGAKKEWDEKGALLKDEKYNADGSRK